MNLQEYKTLIFDCDGVVLDSNRIKTQAFYEAAVPYGEDAARALVSYHVANGGVSRYAKFEKFVHEMLPKNVVCPPLDELLNAYAGFVCTGLMNCDVAEGLDRLRLKTAEARWMIVSGGDQEELRKVFVDRGLDNLFDGGVYGSPETKPAILRRLIAEGNICHPAIFMGDSRYDYLAASEAHVDFILISGWTEFVGWQGYCQRNSIMACRSISDLANDALC